MSFMLPNEIMKWSCWSRFWVVSCVKCFI